MAYLVTRQKKNQRRSIGKRKFFVLAVDSFNPLVVWAIFNSSYPMFLAMYIGLGNLHNFNCGFLFSFSGWSFCIFFTGVDFNRVVILNYLSRLVKGTQLLYITETLWNILSYELLFKTVRLSTPPASLIETDYWHERAVHDYIIRNRFLLYSVVSKLFTAN